ncbi:MAG TPA: HNH endonuclease signature motif containing protein, partial [Acidimicrobiia bacterium]|nr:HNH endonuclease signature motif containing protein [Acidimicrobiia bacterium]
GGAYLRGYAKSGQVCEIAGFGPVPVATVRRQLPGSFVKIVVKKGVDVVNVCHAGRSVPVHLQTALDERDPACVVPGCDVASGLENHHWQDDYAAGGATSLHNLARVCARHHDLITYGGWCLEGGPQRWRFVPPPDDGSGQQRLEDTG